MPTARLLKKKGSSTAGVSAPACRPCPCARAPYGGVGVDADKLDLDDSDDDEPLVKKPAAAAAAKPVEATA